MREQFSGRLRGEPPIRIPLKGTVRNRPFICDVMRVNSDSSFRGTFYFANRSAEGVASPPSLVK